MGLMASGAYAIAPAALRTTWLGLLFSAAFVWLLAQPTRSPLWVVFGGVIAGSGLYLLGQL